MDDTRLAEYLSRIGAATSGTPDIAALRELQWRHLATVPFENLSIHLEERIELTEPALVEKIVDRRRGGFCYELNGGFAALLSGLGFSVRLLAARVFGPNGPGPLFDHLALRVEFDEPYLVDVGFGRFSRLPLRLADRNPQPTPDGEFRVVETADGDLDVSCDGNPEYRLELRPRELADFAPTCWWQQTWPRSHFATSIICSLPTENGRISLNDHTLIETRGDTRAERELSDDEALAAYRDRFGISLDRLPRLRGSATSG